MIREAYKIHSKVKIVKGPKDVVGKEGRIGEIRKDVAGKKSFTVDYDFGDDGHYKSVRCDVSDMRLIKESFKQFITEEFARAQAAKVAKNLLGVLSVEEVPEVPEKVIMGAREEGHKFIDSAAGPWIVSVFKHAGKMFARVTPPKGVEGRQTYFIPTGQH